MCAQCKNRYPIGRVVPYLVKSETLVPARRKWIGPGADDWEVIEAKRRLTYRWLCGIHTTRACAREWHDRYREWLACA